MILESVDLLKKLFRSPLFNLFPYPLLLTDLHIHILFNWPPAERRFNCILFMGGTFSPFIPFQTTSKICTVVLYTVCLNALVRAKAETNTPQFPW